ncbi:MAG TPA: hypothetical protein VM689_01385 [Aliidongia sp.]|nr:hypothetical protein [Aliidongia sp.]
MIADQDATAAAGRPLGAVSTLISLFLLLLVFFIVLFSVAQIHREKANQVLVSVDQAFGGIPSKIGLIAHPAPDALEATPEGFARAISALVTGFASLEASGRPAPNDSLFEIDLPPPQLFDGATVKLVPAAAGSLDRLAVLLQQRRRGQHYRLTLRAVVPAGADQALAADRVASIAASLFAKGCPADALTIGVETGPEPLMRLDFALVGKPEESE